MTTLSAEDLEACLDLAEVDGVLGRRVKEALNVVYDALETYGEDRILISFNGGKDCTVLLHIYAAALYGRRHKNNRVHPVNASSKTSTFHSEAVSRSIHALYIATPSPFDEVEAFIVAAERRYNLSLYRVSSPSSHEVKKGGQEMKYALQAYKSEFPEMEAILVGTRRTDPHGGSLAYKNLTDNDWPRFMRVNPIIEWTYADIWQFLRHLNVSYCSLYDAGYTSLGSTYNTFPNPALRQSKVGIPTGESGTESYLPAYELEDAALERAGRIPTKVPDF